MDKHTAYARDSNINLENGILLYNKTPLNGNLVSLFPKGGIASDVPYRNGRKQGCEKKWFANGALAEERFYTNGIKTGIHKAWWTNRKPQFEYHFNNLGKYHGSSKEWYEKGNLYKDFNYINGKESGKQRLWKPDGRIKANYEVVNGERFGLIGLKRCKTLTISSNQIN